MDSSLKDSLYRGRQVLRQDDDKDSGRSTTTRQPIAEFNDETKRETKRKTKYKIIAAPFIIGGSS